jgi:bifunctional non-homologous end joining protein LigD
MTEDRSLLPQLPSRSKATVESVEWLFEPHWRGQRLMADVRDGRVRVTDEQGEPVGDELAEVAEVLAPAVDAEEALIDGVWTNMPFVGEGSAARHLADAIAEEGLDDELPDPIENEPRRAFVAVDLVELDGQPLHEVPYLERRRLLASVILEDVRVRISPAVRMPLRSWLVAWRVNGFTAYLAKHMNSRYHPGEVAEDWLRLSTAEPRGPSPVTRLFLPTRQRTERISDEPEPEESGSR